MPRKNLENEKNGGELIKIVTPISVINKKPLKPYIELFEFQPENIIQKPLGRLIGMFEIKDFTEDSAYIVNFLTSVVRKEYYINPRRTAPESLESALHKVNVALSELVEHGNTNWLGRFDASVCSIEKNILHFSVTGSARVLLIRNGTLTDISEGLEPESDEAHPIKTFVNISSGKLESGDRIIITTGDIFEIFSPTEIKKASLRFSGEKFIQFIKTALINELDLAGTLIVEVQDPVPMEKSRPRKEKKDEETVPNVFSESAFRPERSKKAKDKTADETKKREKIVDNKTGHIYLQEDDTDFSAAGRWSGIGEFFQEKSHDLISAIKKSARKSWPKIKIAALYLLAEFPKIFSRLKFRTKNNFKEVSFEKPPQKITDLPENEIGNEVAGKKIATNKKSINWKKIFPDWKKISALSSRMTYVQKVSVLIILIIIAALPFFLSRIKKPEPPTETPAPEIPLVMTNNQILAQDKNINLDADIAAMTGLSNPIRPIFSDGQIFIVNADSISSISNDQIENNYPLNIGAPAANAILMEDLNLIFFTTADQKVYSFSPVSKEIKDNAIALPAGSKIKALATYLTFLYMADGQNNMIYRYPRAEGGFGTKVDWLKEQISLSGVNDMAIDDNVYLAENNSLMKLFKGARQSFSVEPTNTPIVFSRIYTNVDVQHIYVLDSPNGRVIKLTKDGMIIRQYYDELLEKAKEFSVDEKNNRAYVITEKDQLAKLEMD